MFRTAALVIAIIFAFAGSTVVTTTGRHHSEHANCLEQRAARKQGNVRAAHLKLLEGAIVASNEKAQSQLPGYTYPPEITALKEHPDEIFPIPLQKC